MEEEHMNSATIKATYPMTLRDLEPEKRRLVHVSRDNELKDAITKMMLNDYSQLPVLQTSKDKPPKAKDVQGYISWRSIGEAYALNRQCNQVRDCMARQPTILDDTEDLMRAARIIAEDEFVLVSNKENDIIGLVTTTDISLYLLERGEPFFLIGQIENSLRAILNNRFHPEEIQGINRRAVTMKQVQGVSDLAFSDYISLLGNEENWKRFEEYRISRGLLVEALIKSNSLRNEVMHFKPDESSDEKMDILRKMADFLKHLENGVMASSKE